VQQPAVVEAPKPEPAKPAAPDSGAQITADVPQAAVQSQRQNTVNLLWNSEGKLNHIGHALNDGEQGMLRQARNYIAQSNQLYRPETSSAPTTSRSRPVCWPMSWPSSIQHAYARVRGNGRRSGRRLCAATDAAPVADSAAATDAAPVADAAAATDAAPVADSRADAG